MERNRECVSAENKAKGERERAGKRKGKRKERKTREEKNKKIIVNVLFNCLVI